MLWCMLALLLVKATTQPIDLQSTPPAPTQQHAAPPPQPTAASMAPDAGEAEPALSSPASLPIDVMKSAERGELHEVVEWLDEGGSVDAMCSVPAGGGEATAAGMLHVAAVRGNLEVVRELLNRGASVDLQTGFGFSALMAAAGFGHHAIVLLLLQHSANPNHQSNTGQAALMVAAGAGQLACVQTLLRAKADTELVDDNDHTALQYAQDKRERSIAKLISSHHQISALPLTSWPWPLTWPWGLLLCVLGVVLGAIANKLALYYTIRQQHRPVDARHAKAKGRRATIAEHTSNSRRHAAPPQPAAKVIVALPAVHQAEQAARPDAAMEEMLAEGHQQTRSKKSKKKAGRLNAPRGGLSEAPTTTSTPAPPTTAPKPAASAAERAEAALRAAITGGGLSAIEWALAAAPREVREGGVGAEARDLCDRVRLLEAQLEAVATRAATEAARLAAAERARPARESMAREAARAVAASQAHAKAKEAAATAAAAVEAAAAAEAEADALERAMADGGECSNNGAARSSEASEAAEVPDDYVCPITAEIMTDPVSTLDGFTYEREAITEWLRTKDTSPLTGGTLESKTLVPNLSLRSIIRRFVEA
jgi:hypothetical protein